jgi:hypothetical protein
LQIFADKNKDYGSSFDVDGIVGIVIRLGDKMKRLKNVTSKGHVIAVSGEGLSELLLDIANYCDIGLMLMEKEYGKAKEAAYCCDESKFIQQSKDHHKILAEECGTISPIGE